MRSLYAILAATAIVVAAPFAARASDHPWSCVQPPNTPPVYCPIPGPPLTLAAPNVAAGSFCSLNGVRPGSYYALAMNAVVRLAEPGLYYSYGSTKLTTAKYDTVRKGATCDQLPGEHDLGYGVMNDGERVVATTGPRGTESGAPPYQLEAWGL